MRNLTVGYFNNEPFVDVCGKYISRIAEVFFAWPNTLSCRPPLDFGGGKAARMHQELKWCRQQGIKLDLLFNCNCYGDIAVSQELTNHVAAILEEMGKLGLYPDVVTSTSPFIATILRRIAPGIEIRASVNMRMHGTIGFEYVKDLFDSFYVSREHQRDFGYMKDCAAWAKQNGKKLGMQVNSGCLRECGYQQFHDNLHGHDRQRQSAEGKKLDFQVFLCKKHFANGRNMEDILRGTWIRPEDVSLFEPYVSLVKLSTRNVPEPGKIIKAYAERHYDGNLLDLLDPQHSAAFAPLMLHNPSFPSDWATSGIAAACARNCRHCGRCTQIINTTQSCRG